MSRIEKKISYFLALGILAASVAFVACERNDSVGSSKRSKVAVPEGFVEQRQLASAVDSLGSFNGSVELPLEKDIALHGKMDGGVPAFMKFLKERKTGFNYIYRKYQAVKPGFEGSISLDITVDVCGDVFSVTEIASTTGVPEFNTELKNSLSRQKFPKTEQGHYTLSFTLNFVKDGSAVQQDDVSDEPLMELLPMDGERLVLPEKDSIIVRGEVAGGSATIYDFISDHDYGLLHCYLKTLRAMPRGAGSITLDVTVDPGGDVNNVSVVSSNTKSPALDVEVKNYLARLKFPASVQGRYTVSIPLRFEKL